MAENNILTCQTCGGTLNFSPDGLYAVCPYCGNEYHFKSRKKDALSLALNRANLMRRSCDFDGAITEYKLILMDDAEDAEANFGLALSIYGIEYVEDSRTKKLIPTCRRTVKQSILENEYYLAAIKYSDKEQAEYYTSQARAIDRLQQDIRRRMNEEEDFDVFICFRSADDNGFPTRERTVARRIYDELERRGIKTFFSEVTLKDRFGDDYEPIIYKALYSCKFFILVALSEENINSVWVKNEWSRFRDRAAEEGLSGACCAVFDNMPLSSLPAFLRSVQGVNLAKYPAGGYEIELADNLCKKFKAEPFEEETVVENKDYPQELVTLLDGAQISLDDEVYGNAMELYEKALTMYPKCGEAWWGYFLAEQDANTGALAAQKTDYSRAAGLKTDRYLRNAEKYGDASIRAKVASYKKMCAYRCGELAVACDGRISELENQITQNNVLLADIGKKKSAAAKKREKAAKLGNEAKYKNLKRTLTLCFIFVIAFFLLMGIFIDDGWPVFLAMSLTFLLMWIFMSVMLNIQHKNAKQQVDELGRQVSGYYAQEKMLRSRNQSSESELEEEKRKKRTFSNVFG